MTGNINFGTGSRLQNTVSILQQMLWLAPSLMVLLPGKGSEMIMDDPLWRSVTTASLIALRNTYVIDRAYHGVCLLMAFLRVVYQGPILNVCGIPWARVPWWRERGKRPAEYWHFPFFPPHGQHQGSSNSQRSPFSPWWTVILWTVSQDDLSLSCFVSGIWLQQGEK